MRGKKNYWLFLGVTMTLAAIAAIACSAARVVAYVIQDLPVVASNYATPVPPTGVTSGPVPLNWWVVGGIIAAVTATLVVVWLVIVRPR
ncbi:hypothetical protein ACFLS8_00430 [Chloroflexota bacterium]